MLHKYSYSVHVQTNFFTCSIGFSSLFLCSTHRQRGYHLRLHTNRMERLKYSCRCSGGKIRPDPGCGFGGCHVLMSGSDRGCLL